MMAFRGERAWLGGMLVFFSLLAAPVQASIILSELYYDAPGPDNGQVFVELWGAPGTVLAGLSLLGINGGDGTTYKTVALSGVIPADGVFVIADDNGSGSTSVSNFDLLAQVDFQNGADSVVLWDGSSALDAVGYGDFTGLFFSGEGLSAVDVASGMSLARRLAGLDTDNNAADFVPMTIVTPGVVPSVVAVSLPNETWLFLTAGFLMSCFKLTTKRA